MNKYIKNGRQCWNVAHIARYDIQGVSGSITGIKAYPSIATGGIGYEGVLILTTQTPEQAENAFNKLVQFLYNRDQYILDLSPFQM